MRAHGFTLIEVILVLAILGVVVAFGFPIYHGYIQPARLMEATAQLGQLSKEVRAWERRNGSLPAAVQRARCARVRGPSRNMTLTLPSSRTVST